MPSLLEIFFFLAVGLVLLYAGAEALVRGSSDLASRLGVSTLVIGLTIVAFGTSAPELVVSVKSSLNGMGDIAVGNVVGSNIFNIAVILGLSAIIKPIKVNLQVLRTDAPIMLALSLILVFLLGDSRISRIEGILLTAGICGYTFFTVYMGRKQNIQSGELVATTAELKKSGSVPFNLFSILGGLAALVLGSRFFVKSAVDFAELMGISQALVGLTIVAAGTSLPELATSVVAAARKQGDIAIGNIIGSNIFNILGILGITSMISPLHIQGIGIVELCFMAGTAILLLPFMRTGFVLNRLEGVLLLGIYGGYLYYLWP
ncbi:MAG: calcium/sodium antiporter [bacterium]